MATFCQLSFYAFFTLENPAHLQTQLREKLQNLDIKGTILLGDEGINASLSVTTSIADEVWKSLIQLIPALEGALVKRSYAQAHPFGHFKIKIKPEIVTMGVSQVKPHESSAPYIKPETLRKWYEDGKEFLILDTRNDYEFQLGKFQGSEQLSISHFRDFPHKVGQLKDKQGDRPIVTYCTGGIRCEKAAPYLLAHGIRNVYQLEGGILNYFENCQGNFWEGDCFVFDDRVAVDANLKTTGAFLCKNCQYPLKKDALQCSHCQTLTGKETNPLPASGSTSKLK